MANQPIKKRVRYEDYFSDELKQLVDYIVNEVSQKLSFSEITPEIFIMGGLEKQDSLIYCLLGGFLIGTEIQEIHDSISNSISEEQEVVRPGSTVEFSDDLKRCFAKAFEMMGTYSSSVITSDMVLISFLSINSHTNKTKKLFLNHMFDEETAKNNAMSLHGTVTAISKLSDSEFETVKEAMDEGNYDNNENATGAIIAIISNGGSGLTCSFEDLKQAFEEPKKGEKKVAQKLKIPYCTLLEGDKLQPVVLRDAEIAKMARIISRKRDGNVMIVGDSGVGKTALVEGLARMISYGNAPAFFRGREIWKINVTEVWSGANLRGQLEGRIDTIRDTAESMENPPIFFIDGIQWKDTNGDIEMVDAFFSVFSETSFPIIMTATHKGYKTFLEQSPSVAKLFQKIELEEPSIEDCIEILMQCKSSYEEFHGVHYDEAVVAECVRMAKTYIAESSLPKSAFDVLDEAGCDRKLSLFGDNDEIEELRSDICQLTAQKEEDMKAGHLEDADIIQSYIDEANGELEKKLGKLKSKKKELAVSEENVWKVVSDKTGVPVEKVGTNEKKRLANLADVLKKSIIGQDEAIEIVTNAIKRNKIGVKTAGRPTLSCMCIGNTGCGKTLLAKKLASEIFGDEKYLVRFDMSEYSDGTSVNKLIGSSAGYVGYDNGGLLTEAISKRKYAVLLFDEIEKATTEVYNLLLQVIDEGFITDNKGKKVDFRNTVIVMTSNVGAKEAANSKVMGFNPDQNANKRDIIEKELKHRFPPEFINRLDEIIYFNPLTDENLRAIVDLEIGKTKKKYEEGGYEVTFEPEVSEYVYERALKEKEYGARPIARVIRKEIEDPLTDCIIKTETKNEFNVSVIDGEISVG